MKLFSKLTPQQEADFRLWARQNYKPFEPIPGVWHPVIQAECAAINLETNLPEEFTCARSP